MTIFEFVMVLLSIVIGLGISRLLTGFGELLQSRRPLSSMYWLLLVQALFQMLWFVALWWTAWSFSEHESWNIVLVLVLLLGSAFFFLAGYVIFPLDSGTTDSREHYYAQHRTYYGLLAAGLATMVAMSLLLLEAPWASQAGNFVLLVPLLILATFGSRWLHETVLVLTTVLFLVSVILAG